MDHQLRTSDLEHDHLEEVAGTVWACEEETRRVVAKLDPGDRVHDRVLDVLVRHPVTPCRPVDLHTD